MILPVLTILLLVVSTGMAYAQPTDNSGNYKIPQWTKHIAQWWANGQIGDDDYLKGMEYLINHGMMKIPTTQPASSMQQGIPDWIKQNAKLWSSSQLKDSDYIKGIQYLVANNMIHVKIKSGNLLLHIFSPKNPPELIAIFDKHTTSQDFVSNFRTQILDLYPNLNHCLNTYSMDSIKAAIAIAKIHGNVKYVAYDNEKGNENLSTPPSELVDPAASTNQAASLVKQAGLGFSAQPTRALLMEEYKGVDWTKVDFMVMQMQKFTKDDVSFISDVTTVSDWIKSKNPNTIVFVQVNTAFDTTPHLISLIKSVSDKIDGVSIVIPDAATVEPLLVGIGR